MQAPQGEAAAATAAEAKSLTQVVAEEELRVEAGAKGKMSLARMWIARLES